MSKDKEPAAAPMVDPNTLKENEIARTVIGTGVKADGFRVDFRGGAATLTGTVRSEEDRKRIVEAARSVGGVSAISDSMKVGTGSGASLGTNAGSGGGRSYTVKSGDTLSEIAQSHYGDASKYNRIFEANRNILSDPDEIQPGQVLNIPE